jgi:hypothetical protein
MKRTRRLALIPAAAALAALALAACGSDKDSGTAASQKLPQGSEKLDLKPADFTTNVDNPYFPIKPGSRWVYRETDSEGGNARDEMTVLAKTKKIANGIEARVVHDVTTEKGRKLEDTFDWYAQDSAGNVWYLGEDTTAYDPGKPPSTAGSFEAGVHGAQPGVIMPAKPATGLHYQQEYYAGHAEDRAKILGANEQAEAPFGHFTHVVMTSESNPLEPKVSELKFYARGVGVVLAVSVSGETDREELLSYSEGK